MSREDGNMDGNVVSTDARVPNDDIVETTAAEDEAAVGDGAAPVANEMEKVSSDVSKPSVLAMPSIICRICLANEELESLLSPCMCKGTHGFVHQQCLEYWLSRSGLSHCELCLFHFPTAYHLRYGMWESMRIWFSHPSHRALLQSDILLCMLLSIITFGLVAISMFGMYYLTAFHPNQYNQTATVRYWTETSVGVFLGIVIFAFVLNTIVVVKANIIPWFRITPTSFIQHKTTMESFGRLHQITKLIRFSVC